MDFSSDFFIRIMAALVLGFLLGLERELTNKYAGLRTHILVCLGACIFTIISIYGFPTFVEGDNVIVPQATGIRDSGRVAAQIVSGIGFIGAGAVLRNGPMIIGLTTAATLWISAAIGMTCGVGMYDVAILATVISVAVLTLIRIFERRILPTSIKRAKRFKLTVYCNESDVKGIQEFLSCAVDNMEEFSAKRLLENPEKSKVSSRFELSQKKVMNVIYNKLTEVYTLDSVTMQELND
ncbi:MAG: MgtC/SapB family protein [Candidatus Gastranaerophilales bacterium]|nr:MgtC/SapB family protein [Candidatus Gastranaerophilales bacterium]MCM1073311.1 MgtC/SapB family protein [Bacteroides sp.]